MSSQAVIVYISREGGEIGDLMDLQDGREVELDWVGSLNGADVPIKIRLSEIDDQEITDFPQDPEHARTCIHDNEVWFGHECGICDGEGHYVWKDQS